jgi:hypothetical protein
VIKEDLHVCVRRKIDVSAGITTKAGGAAKLYAGILIPTFISTRASLGTESPMSSRTRVPATKAHILAFLIAASSFMSFLRI